jgi:hypothetical protein
MDIKNINPSYIDSLAANLTAVNAAKSIAKNKIVFRNISDDNSLIFGECSGSGKSNYGCSFDVLSGTARCTCPSRQIPCKHVLGLLYAFAEDKNSFTVAEIPEDIAKKRERSIKRVSENQTAQKRKPVSDEKRAKIAGKRIAVQLEGIDIAEKILNEIIKLGFVALNNSAILEYRERVKNLGNYYINGVLIRFNELLEAIIIAQNNNTDNHLKAAILLFELISQVRIYLTEKMKNPLDIRTDTDMEEQLGYVWKNDKLIEASLTLKNAELAELYYIRNYDGIRKEWVTESSFINFTDGSIYRRVNYYPNKRNLKITEDYSYDVINVPEAMIFPGVINRRIRFSSESVTAFTPKHANIIKEIAENDFFVAIKNAKNILRNPLNTNHVIALLIVDDIFQTEEKQSVICDKNGVKIGLSENIFSYKSADSCLNKSRLIHDLSKDFVVGNVLCVSLEINLTSGSILAAPMSIINDKEIIRLL